MLSFQIVQNVLFTVQDISHAVCLNENYNYKRHLLLTDSFQRSSFMTLE